MRTAMLLLSGLTLAIVFNQASAQAQGASWLNQRAAEVALSDGTVQFRYLTGGDKVNVDNGMLNLGVFLSEERDVVLSGALLVPVDLDLGRRLSVSLGPQIYAALLEEENNDVFALAFGLEARYELARSRDLAVVGQAFYSPDISTFGAADNVTDMSARLEMRVTPTLIGFGGARWFELDLLERQERELQEELFVGARWRFK